MDIINRVILKPGKRLGRKCLNLIEVYRQLSRGSAPVVVIYQMGKVGSMSIRDYLWEHYPGAVFHDHIDSLRNRFLYYWSIVNKKKIKFISLVREPIGRNVSMFFQDFEKYTGVPRSEANFSIEELKEIFLSNFNHEQPLEWFDKNILEPYGIDVFSTPFPEKGISIYSSNNIELLVMRCEISNNDKSRAINSFLELVLLDVDGFQLENKNIGKLKDYSATYKDFLSKVRFSPDYINRMCESKYFNHFYSKEVINEVRKKWSES